AVAGIREKTRDSILKGIAIWRAGRARMPLAQARTIAREVVAALTAQARVERIEIAGSLRRARETVKDIDLLATATDPARVIEAALSGTLPALVTADRIRGDLHAHTDWSDGHHPIETLIEAAEARGYEYIIVSDHSQSATVARGLSVDRLREQIRTLRALQPR